MMAALGYTAVVTAKCHAQTDIVYHYRK